MVISSTGCTFFLKRLLVMAGTWVAYDQTFHRGINIIRSEGNSTGKSTIANMIFLAMGGDARLWNHDALQCSAVIAELEINGHTITTRRKITAASQMPMDIFWGSSEEAARAPATAWESFPFRRGASHSFSQALFRILGFPEVFNEEDRALTLHQLLRLIYIDQLSDTLSLMRDEDFDSPITRTAIGDFLFGAYDDKLHENKIKLRDSERSIPYITREISSLERVLKEASHEIDVESVQAMISETEEKIRAIEQQVRLMDQAEISSSPVGLDLTNLANGAIRASEDLALHYERIARLEYEISDSQKFIETLRRRLADLEHSNQVLDLLLPVPIEHCPKCLQAIGPASLAHCCLCKQPAPSSTNSILIRMREELSFQISESEDLMIKRKTELQSLNDDLPKVKHLADSSMKAYHEATSALRVPQNKGRDTLLIQKGEFQGKINELINQSKAVLVLKNHRLDRERLDSEIKTLKSQINYAQIQQADRISDVHRTIADTALRLIRSDLPYEEAFRDASMVDIDFRLNSFSLNKRNLFSASSLVLLKNAVRFSIFFASLRLDYMRYPRFILCDNMEDKGMVEARSRNFQRQIVALASSFDVPYQIIFTTSMIDPDLEIEQYCIGPRYHAGLKTLNKRAR